MPDNQKRTFPGPPASSRMEATHSYVAGQAVSEPSVASHAEGRGADGRGSFNNHKIDHGIVEALGEAVAAAAAVEPVKIIPQVRKCNVMHFKNNFGSKDEMYAVDVLESESSEVGPQLQAELKLRRNRPGRLLEKERAARANAELATTVMPPLAQGSHFGHSKTKLLLRIRIQSPALLEILSKIITNGTSDWKGRPRTFMRPFAALIYHQGEVREYLQALEERHGHSAHHDAGDATPLSTAVSEHDNSGSGVKRDVSDGPAALAELRCYVEFMDDEVMNLYNKFDNLSAVDGAAAAKVRFHDLWCLFRPGELVFRPIGTGAVRELDNPALGHRMWRCYGTRPSWTKHRLAPEEHRSYVDEYDESDRDSFGVHCYYIDYTGSEFCVVTETFEIAPFKGQRDIKSLRVFPYRFADDYKALYQATIDNGRRFLESFKVRHASYSGWTTTVTPRGTPTTDVEGSELRRPEYVDSEVIVDFGEAFQTWPAWQPTASIIRPEEPFTSEALDDFPIYWWSDTARTRLLRETNEMIVVRSGITALERNANLSADNEDADQFLVRVRQNDRNGNPTTEEDLNKNDKDPQRCDLPLLPSRVFAYVLRDRKFAQLVIQQLSPVNKSADAFDYLKINPGHQEIVQSLVEEHFEKKVSDRKGGIKVENIDVIRGKGKGLFILLYGVPGVGKTATAEAIAAANGKPLFPITCGDLGLTPMAVEKALLRIFRLADTWNCVLLLDEVDTFFSQRAKGDAALAKNALVSVFLRVLEYYDGLLFMTTNRPGALDEAFKSRIHLKLFYPRLNEQQTMDIWRMNIDRLKKIEQERRRNDATVRPLQVQDNRIMRFAKEMFRLQVQSGSTAARWNGRQIRNAFQVASSLAHYEARRDGTEPRLTVQHFRTVKEVTEEFDQFMHDTLGKSEAQLAYERGERDDEYEARARYSHDEEDEPRETRYRDRDRSHLGERGYDGARSDAGRSPSPHVSGPARPRQPVTGSGLFPNGLSLGMGTTSQHISPPSPGHRGPAPAPWSGPSGPGSRHVPDIHVTGGGGGNIGEPFLSAEGWSGSVGHKRQKRDRSASSNRGRNKKVRSDDSDEDDESDHE